MAASVSSHGRVVGKPATHDFGRSVGAYERGDATGGRTVGKPADDAAFGRHVGAAAASTTATADAVASAATVTTTGGGDAAASTAPAAAAAHSGRSVGKPAAHDFGRSVGAYERGDATGGRTVGKPADDASFGRRVGRYEHA